MKLAIASFLVGSAAAFAPAAPVGVRSSVLNMAETATETVKVRIVFMSESWTRKKIQKQRRLIMTIHSD